MNTAIPGLIVAIGTMLSCSEATRLELVVPAGVAVPEMVGQAGVDAVVVAGATSWLGPVTRMDDTERAPTHLLTQLVEGPSLKMKIRPRSLRDLDGAIVAIASTRSAEYLSLVASAITEGMQVEVLQHHRATPSEGAIGVLEAGTAARAMKWFERGHVDAAFADDGHWSLRTSADWVLAGSDGFVAPPGTAGSQFEPLPTWAVQALLAEAADLPTGGTGAPPAPRTHGSAVVAADRQMIVLTNDVGGELSVGEAGVGRGQFLGLSRVVEHGDRLFAVDSARHRVQVFSSRGEWETQLPAAGEPAIEYLVDIAIDDERVVWALDAGRGQVLAIESNGAVRGALSAPMRGPARVDVVGAEVVVWDALLEQTTKISKSELQPLASPAIVRSEFVLGVLGERNATRELRPLGGLVAKMLDHDTGLVVWFDDAEKAARALREERVDLLLASGVHGLQLAQSHAFNPLVQVTEHAEAAAAVLVSKDDRTPVLAVARAGRFSNAHPAAETLASDGDFVDAGSASSALAWVQTDRASAAVVSSRDLASAKDLVELGRTASLVDGVVLVARDNPRLREILLALEAPEALGPARIRGFQPFDATSPAARATSEIADEVRQ